MRRLIIADAHLGQSRGDVVDMADLVRRSAGGGFREIVYLGDAFQYLIGMSKFWTEGVRLVLEAWDEVRKVGVRIAVVEGNRDFFLDEPDLAAHIDWSGRRYQFRAGDRIYRLDHGDRVNLRDLQYQFWSRISKSPVARLSARILPQALAVTIVRGMEARLATTNMRFRYRTPVESLRKAACRAFAEGVDVLLWGHFHASWSCAMDGRLAMVVPAWLDTRRALAVESDGRWSWLEKNLTVASCDPRMP